MIRRASLLHAVAKALRESPVVALVGPRQCGKTTLAGLVAREHRGPVERFDLEDPLDLARLENPRLVLGEARGLVVLDEFQRLPALFEVLRVLVDRPRAGARFLVLGSASPRLVRGLSETLAGRIRFVEMGGFGLNEVVPARFPLLWLRGGFPRSFLALSEPRSLSWRQDFIRTFLERDIPQLGITVPPATLRRFWTMVAHYHGQTWNAAEFARSLGASEPTARRYLDLLTGAYVVRQLPPWFENLGKRQVKAPKIYLRDTGLLHALLSLPDRRALLGHPKAGASWEGFALEQVLGLTGADDAYCWATHNGAELDLLLTLRGNRVGFEFKHSDAPRPTKSMRIALEDLRLQRLLVVHPGDRSFRMDRRIEALAITDLPQALGVGR